MSETAGRPRDAARELADSTAPPELTLRRMGYLTLRALPFMRPMLKHIIVVMLLGLLLIILTTFALTFSSDLFANKVLLSEKIQPVQALLLGLDDGYVKQAFLGEDATASESVDDLTVAQRKTVRNRMIVWFVIGGGIWLVVTAIVGYYGAWVWQNVNQYLRVTMVERLEHLSLRFHSDSRTGDAIYRIFNDSAQIVNVLSGAVIGPCMLIFSLAVALTFILAFDPLILVAILLVAIPMFWLTVKFTPRIRRRSVANRAANSNLTSRLQETFNALKVVKANRAENLVMDRFNLDSHKALDAALSLRLEMVVLSVLVTTLGGATVIALEYTMAGWVIERRETLLGAWAAAFIGFTYWNLGAFQAAVGRVRESFSTIGRADESLGRAGYGLVRIWCMIQDLYIGLERAYYFLDIEPEVSDSANPVEYPSPISSVTWQGVNFSYQEGEQVLEGVDLHAEAGTVTAIVGATGSGKSTLMSLLLRLYDPDQGAIWLNDVDIRDLKIDDIRTNSAIALQKNVLFSGTVSDNIGYAVAGASRQDVEASARVACADEFIQEMDAGYDSDLGERGAKLSAGQRQRLTIARAVIRDTPILILDEPTASLDAETEHRVLANLSEWGKDKVVFLITHRLSTIRSADQIAFLEDGRITEIGSHDELMAQPEGRYRSFVRAETMGAADVDRDGESS